MINLIFIPNEEYILQHHAAKAILYNNKPFCRTHDGSRNIKIYQHIFIFLLVLRNFLSVFRVCLIKGNLLE